MKRKRTQEAERAARKEAEQDVVEKWKQAGLTKSEQEDHAWFLHSPDNQES